MSFTNITFWLGFFPVFFLLYHACGSRRNLQNVLLVLGSMLFYGTFGLEHLTVLTLCILLTYAGALLGARFRAEKWGGWFWGGLIALNLGILLWYKYAAFALEALNLLGSLVRVNIPVSLPQVLLPVGLSFYIFQSTSYLIDVFRGDIQAEKNFLTYAAFVSFFPTIVSGPILKSKEALPAFRQARKIGWTDVERGFFSFLYGAFLKVVIANRLNLLTAAVFDNHAAYTGWYLLIAAVAYSFQIYTDFSGYSFMAIGVGRLLGFRIPDNFRQPYFAESIIDFWKRWHISLTSWFRDHLYISLGGNRKGKLRRYANVLAVFLVSGLWHGASFNFILWGGCNALLQIWEMTTGKLRRRLEARLGLDTARWDWRFGNRLLTFALVTVCWVFFRIPSCTGALGYLVRMCDLRNVWVLFDKSLFSLGLTGQEMVIAGLSLLVLLFVSRLREQGRMDAFFRQGFALKYLVFLGLFLSILVYGVYGAEYSSSQFIYAGF